MNGVLVEVLAVGGVLTMLSGLVVLAVAWLSRRPGAEQSADVGLALLGEAPARPWGYRPRHRCVGSARVSSRARTPVAVCVGAGRVYRSSTAGARGVARVTRSSIQRPL